MSGKSERPAVCWDSCVFIAWLKREQDKPLSEIARALREIRSDKVVLYLPAVAYAEVLNTAAVPNARATFRRFALRPNIVRANIDHRIAEAAADIRQRSYDFGGGSRKTLLKTPDALVVATARIYNVPLIFTFDKLLLRYSGTDVLFGIEARHPVALCPAPKPKGPPNKELFTESGDAQEP